MAVTVNYVLYRAGGQTKLLASPVLPQGYHHQTKFEQLFVFLLCRFGIQGLLIVPDSLLFNEIHQVTASVAFT